MLRKRDKFISCQGQGDDNDDDDDGCDGVCLGHLSLPFCSVHPMEKYSDIVVNWNISRHKFLGFAYFMERPAQREPRCEE